MLKKKLVEGNGKKKKSAKKKKKGTNKARLNPFAREDLADAVHKLAKKIGKEYGIQGIYTDDMSADIECFSTGFQALDDVITGQLDDDWRLIEGSGKGFPRGRIVEVWGAEGSGKSTLALCAIAEAQRNGEVCAFIDVEHALDPEYATKVIGVNFNELIYQQPDDGESAMAAVTACVKEGCSIVVVDSVSALSAIAELGGSKAQGQQARLMSTELRKLNTLLKPGGPTVIFINQIRYKLNVMFGNPETTSGGNALRFYASVRGRTRKVEELKKTIDGQSEVVGSRVEFQVRKNKVGPAFRKMQFDVKYNRGISNAKLVKKKKKKKKKEKKDDDGS